MSLPLPAVTAAPQHSVLQQQLQREIHWLACKQEHASVHQAYEAAARYQRMLAVKRKMLVQCSNSLHL